MTALQVVLSFLGVVLAAAIGGYVTYKVAKRPKTGQVATSEAETLWAQAQEMRTELRAEVTECKLKLEKLDEENTTLRKGLIAAEEKILGQRVEILNLREHLSQLKTDLQDALKEVARQAEQTSSIQGDVSTVKREMAVLQGGRV